MPSLGFIGLGDMGGPMARRLLEDDYDLTVYGRGADLPAVEAAGATVLDTYEAVGRTCDVIFLCLPGPDTVEHVIFGDDALADGLTAGSVVIDTTTSLPALTDEIAHRLDDLEVTVLSAPISGGRMSAEQGELSVMVGGDPAVFDELTSVFEPFSKNVFHVGDGPADGHALKLVNNFLSFTALLATSEGIALGRQAGLEMETMLDVINESSGRNHATMNQFPERIVTGSYDTGFPLALFEKDVRLLSKFAESMEVPIVYGNLTRNLIGYARSHYGDDADMMRVYDFFEEMMARDTE